MGLKAVCALAAVGPSASGPSCHPRDKARGAHGRLPLSVVSEKIWAGGEAGCKVSVFIPSGGHVQARTSVPILGARLLILDMFIHDSLKCSLKK